MLLAGCLSSLVVGGLVLWLARSVDAMAVEDEARLVRTGLAGLVQRMTVSTVDYAWWEEAYDLVLASNDDEVFSNLGSGATANETFDLLSIIQPDGVIRYGWRTGGDAAPDPTVIPGKIMSVMARKVGELPLEPVTAAHGFAIVDDRPTILSASRISPYTFEDVHAANLPILVTGFWLTDEIVAQMGERLLIDDLSLHLAPVRSVAPGSGVAITALDGAQIAHFGWRNRDPGSAVLRWALPGLGIAVSLLFATFAAVGRKFSRQTRSILAEQRNARYAARTDRLTGLLNRHGFSDICKTPDVTSAIGSGAAALIYVDLDGFKRLNDRAGHEGGDQALRVIARRLRAATRADDIVARVGGDEFLVVLLDEDPEAAAKRVMHFVADACEEPIKIDGEYHLVEPSAGIALSGTGTDLNTLVANADAAMYAAKEGRQPNGVFYKPELTAVRREEQHIEARLRHGLERAAEGESPFRIAYQPIIDTGTERMAYAEALLRWHDEELGSVPPGTFIGVAERFGLVPEIGLMVLRQVCFDLKAAPELKASVNVSPLQLRDAGFAGQVDGIVSSAGVSPDRITLELTETALIEMPHLAKAQMSALRALGIRLSLDDFGTGFSSISYLNHFEFDCLKIDRSFISTLGSGVRSDMMFQSIVQLGKAFRLDIVAEGIETQRQMKIARLAGCDFEQGYLHAKPMPFDELIASQLIQTEQESMVS